MIILHHLGLGDHIICNGMVRNICKNNHDMHHLFCKPHNEDSVRFMFEDLNNLEIHIGYDEDAFNFAKKNEHIDIFEVGFSKLKSNSEIAFDEQFYQHAKMKFSVRWDDFYCNLKSRMANQKEVFKHFKEKYDIKPKNYAFVHEDPSRNLNINYERVSKDLKIVKPELGLTDNIFDYYMLINMSAEVHCIDSSFKHVTESVLQDRPFAYLGVESLPDLFYHTYARGNDNIHVASSRLPWRRLKSA